jgi:hypothetical protein
MSWKRFLIFLLMFIYGAEIVWGLTIYHVISWNVQISHK